MWRKWRTRQSSLWELENNSVSLLRKLANNFVTNVGTGEQLCHHWGNWRTQLFHRRGNWWTPLSPMWNWWTTLSSLWELVNTSVINVGTGEQLRHHCGNWWTPPSSLRELVNNSVITEGTGEQLRHHWGNWWTTQSSLWDLADNSVKKLFQSYIIVKAKYRILFISSCIPRPLINATNQSK